MGILISALLWEVLLPTSIFAIIFFSIIFISKRIVYGGIINSKYTISTMFGEIKVVLSALK